MKRLFPWKGVTYHEEPEFHEPNHHLYKMRAMNFRTEICRLAKSINFATRVSEPGIMFLGDEIFLVKVIDHEFVVWCFDKHLCMASKEQNFVRLR